MGRINIGRLMLGGLIAGLVADALAYLVDGIILAERSVRRNGLPQPWPVLGHAVGLVQRPGISGQASSPSGFMRLSALASGPGPLLPLTPRLPHGSLPVAIPNFEFMWVLGLFEHHLTIFTTLGALAEIVVGTVLGAALYQEVED